MANVKISALPAVTTVVPGTDVLPLVSNSGATTTKATPNDIVNATLVAPGPIGGTTRGTSAFTTELVGPSASANFTRFPNALAVVSSTSAGIQVNESHNIGIMAEGTANSANTAIYGVGVYGAGYTASATRCGGVIGEGHVSASADTGSAIGVRGYSNDTHSGGLNIGVFGEATGSSTGNYAIYSNTASGTNNYNLYIQGTADNLFAGKVIIGSSGDAGTTLSLTRTLTGATSATGTWLSASVLSDVTTNAFGFRTNIGTQAASFTLPSLTHVFVNQAAFGAGSTVTNQYGFFAQSALTGATNNYGFYSNIASSSGRWNFYAGGTASNYFAGDLTIYGGTAVPAGGTAGIGYKFSSTANLGVFFGSGAPTLSAAKGSLYLRSDGTGTNDRMYVNTNGSTTWTAVVTVA